MRNVLIPPALFVLALCYNEAKGQRTISVNPTTGNDTLCKSNSSEPCQSLRGALGVIQPIEDIVIILSNGTHHLQESFIVDGINITLEAAMALEAVLQCTDPTGCAIAVVNGTNVTFRGIVLENCGPESACISVNGSDNILVEECVFRLDSSHCLHV